MGQGRVTLSPLTCETISYPGVADRDGTSNTTTLKLRWNKIEDAELQFKV